MFAILTVVVRILFVLSGECEAVPVITPNHTVVRFPNQKWESISCRDENTTEWYMVKGSRIIAINFSSNCKGQGCVTTPLLNAPMPGNISEENAHFYFCVRKLLVKSLRIEKLNTMVRDKQAAIILITEGPVIYEQGLTLHVRCDTAIKYGVPDKRIISHSHFIKEKGTFYLAVSNTTSKIFTGIYQCGNNWWYIHFYDKNALPFILTNNSTPVKYNETMLVHFEFYGDPEILEVKWLTPNNKSIKIDDNHYEQTLTPIGFNLWKAMLLVRAPTMADLGNYMAVIRIRKPDQSDYYATITRAMHLAPALVSISPRAVRLQLGEFVHVSCEVASYPLPTSNGHLAVTWSWKDTTTTTGQPPTTRIIYNDSLLAYVAYWRPERSGTVRCSMGDQHRDATIEIPNEPPDMPAPYPRPSISIDATALRLQVGDEARVSCSVSGYKQPSIVWSWYECPPPLGDGSLWPNRTLCRQRDDFADTSSVVSQHYVPKQYNETIAWQPTRPGFIECGAPPLEAQSARVYLLDHKMPLAFETVRRYRADEPYQELCVMDKYNHSGRVQWRLNGQEVLATNDGRVRLGPEQTGSYTQSLRLMITCMRDSDKGTYDCVVVGERYTDVLYRIVLEDPSDWLVVGLGISSFVVLCSSFAGWLFYRRGREAGLRQAGIKHFISGDMNNYNQIDKWSADQAYMLPYETSLEFPLKQLRLSKCELGAGAFGVVYRAQAIGIEQHVAKTTVAVKMSRSSDSNDAIRSLISELKIMTHIGRHENVLRLLGAVTQSIHRRRIYVITEFCELGNLVQFLRERQKDFVDQLCGDRPTQKVKDEQEPLLTAGTSRSSSSPISTTDLLRWSVQAAKGMQYLVSRGVVHGDVAARNCLLNGDSVLKIGDFGLSRALRANEDYQKVSKAPLPVKWMAIEAIRDNCFNTATDVWSYGVLLWELLSLGEAPYAGLPNVLVLNRLQIGYRMPQPPFAPPALYQMMRECWSEDPIKRPDFEAIVKCLSEMQVLGVCVDAI